ncbi:calcium-binding protein [Embleya sp. NPDC001921]
MYGRRWFARMATAWLTIVAAVTGAGLANTAASAPLSVAPTTVYVDGGVVYVVGAPGLSSSILVQYDHFYETNTIPAWSVYDPAGGVAVGPGCNRDVTHFVLCPNVSRAVIDGGDGDDRITVSDQLGGVSCVLYGGSGNDTLAPDSCRVEGGSGDDAVDLYYNATALGGDGNDTFVVHGGTYDIAGGAGRDAVNYGWATTAVSVTLDGIADDGLVGHRNSNIRPDVEDVSGGTGNDAFAAYGAVENSFRGGDGDDLLIGGPGNDTLDGGFGNDTLKGGAGVDVLVGGPGIDICDVGADGGTASNDCEA